MFLENVAGSTGRCNTSLQFICRRLKTQGLSRALIETQRDLWVHPVPRHVAPRLPAPFCEINGDDLVECVKSNCLDVANGLPELK